MFAKKAIVRRVSMVVQGVIARTLDPLIPNSVLEANGCQWRIQQTRPGAKHSDANPNSNCRHGRPVFFGTLG